VTRSLIIYISSFLLLLLTVLASARAGREVSVGDFPLASIPARVGEWTWDQAVDETPRGDPLSPAGDTLMQYRTYVHPSGRQVKVVIKVTSSRIGSMRDFATAYLASGWTPEHKSVWETSMQGVPFPVRLTKQILNHGPARRYTLNWYVSPDRQAVDLKQAVLAGWLAKLTRDPVWGQVFIYAHTEQADPAGERAVRDVATGLLPAFYTALGAYAGRISGSG
jgi:hypothetical protein